MVCCPLCGVVNYDSLNGVLNPSNSRWRNGKKAPKTWRPMYCLYHVEKWPLGDMNMLNPNRPLSINTWMITIHEYRRNKKRGGWSVVSDASVFLETPTNLQHHPSLSPRVLSPSLSLKTLTPRMFPCFYRAIIIKIPISCCKWQTLDYPERICRLVRLHAASDRHAITPRSRDRFDQARLGWVQCC